MFSERRLSTLVSWQLKQSFSKYTQLFEIHVQVLFPHHQGVVQTLCGCTTCNRKWLTMQYPLCLCSLLCPQIFVAHYPPDAPYQLREVSESLAFWNSRLNIFTSYRDAESQKIVTRTSSGTSSDKFALWYCCTFYVGERKGRMGIGNRFLRRTVSCQYFHVVAHRVRKILCCLTSAFAEWQWTLR